MTTFIHKFCQISLQTGVLNMYRPQIKVVDCTIRDGGLLNNSNFSLDTVQQVYKSVCSAGVDIIELG